MRYIAIALVLACSSKPSQPAELAWMTDETQAFDRARRDDKGVMVQFFASWAQQSLLLDKSLKTQAVAIEKRFVPLKIDVGNETDALRQLQDRYKVVSAPALVFVSTTGKELGRVVTNVDDRDLASLVEKASAGL